MAGFVILTSAGCQHDATNVTPSSNNPTIVTGTPTGKWTITTYLDNGRNEAGDFSGYSFAFDGSGSMTAEKNGQTTTGSWQENSNDGLQKFRITLNTNDNKLSKLNHNWVINAKTESEINLKDDDASGETLSFTRQ